LVKGVTEVPGAGRFSIIIDPTGAALGLWKPKERGEEGRSRWWKGALRGIAMGEVRRGTRR